MKLCIHGLTRSIWLLAVATMAACGGGNDSVDTLSNPAIKASVPFPARKAVTVTGASGVVIGMHQALYGIAPSNVMLLDHTAQATTDASTFAQKLASTLNNNSHADLAKLVLDNLGVTPTSVPAINARGESEYHLLMDAVKQAFAAFPTMRGQVILNMTNLLAGLEIDATYGAAATAYNKHAADNFSESSIVDPTTCVDKEVIGVVAFRGEGLAFSPQVDGFALMMAPLTNGLIPRRNCEPLPKTSSLLTHMPTAVSHPTSIFPPKVPGWRYSTGHRMILVVSRWSTSQEPASSLQGMSCGVEVAIFFILD